MESVSIAAMARRVAWLVASTMVATSALAGAGDLDASFGTNGIARYALPSPASGTSTSWVAAAALQPDGKIVVVGTADQSQGSTRIVDTIVMRLNANGSLDSSFSADGTTIIDLGGNDSPSAVLITSDNKILVVGRTGSPAQLAGAKLARLNADGSLDATFGQGGRATYPALANLDISSVVELSNGRFVVGGSRSGANRDFSVFAVLANGTLDTAFGTGGSQFVDFGGANDRIAGVRRLPGDRIVAVGESNRNGVQSIGLAMFNSAGQLDTSFGSGSTTYNIQGWNSVWDLEMQSDGKLLIAGGMRGGSSALLGMVLRLNPDGSLDRSFGSQGRVLRSDEFKRVVAAPDGQVYVAGDLLGATLQAPPFGRSRGFVEALESDGSPATAFAGSGGAVLEAGHDDVISDFRTVALLRQADGRLVAIGSSQAAEVVAIGIAAGGEHSGIISVERLDADPLSTYVISESAAAATFAVERTGGSHGSVSVDYVAESSVAVAGQDFVATSGTLAWGDGETGAKIVSLPLIDDTDYEVGYEEIDLRIFNPGGGASLGTSIATTGVSSDEGTTSVRLSPSEAPESVGTLFVMATRTGDARVRAVVQYNVTSAHRAQPNIDFIPISGTLVWAPFDMAPKLIPITLLDNAIEDGDKELNIALSSTSPGVSANVSDRATIRDDDGMYGAPTTSPTLVTEGAGSITVTVNRPGGTGAISATVSVVDLNTSNVTGPDVGAPSATTLNWAASDSTPRSITIPIINDAVAEGPEEFAVQVVGPSGTFFAERFTILDNDADAPGLAKLSFAQGAMTVDEDAGTVSITVNRSGPAAFPVQAEVWYPEGSALPGTDTGFSAQILTWSAGDSTPRTIVISIIDDAVPEPPEYFKLSMRFPSGGVGVGPFDSINVTILDDDGYNAAVGFAQDEVVVSEDAEYVDLPVATTGAPGDAVAQLRYSVRDGGTADPREYALERGRPSRQLAQSNPFAFRIYLNGDRQFEGDETFTVDLQGLGVPLARSSTTVRLISDDTSTPAAPMQVGFITTAITQREDQSSVNVTVRRTGALDSAVAVQYETAAGTAVAGEDFVAAIGQLQWAAGDTADKTIVLILTNDSAAEATETMTLRLFAPTNGATLAESLATITITDDDSPAPPPPNNGGSGGGGQNGSGGGGSAGGGSSGGGGGGGSTDLGTLLVLLALVGACPLQRRLRIRG